MRERIRNGAAILIAVLAVALALLALFMPHREFTGITLRRTEPGTEPSALIVATVDPASGASRFIQPGMVVEEVNYAPWGVLPSTTFDAALRGDFVELGYSDGPNSFNQITFPATDRRPTWFVFLVGLGLLLGTVAWVRRGQAGETLRPYAVPLAVATATALIVVPTQVAPSWLVAIIGVTLATVALLVLADCWIAPLDHRSRRRVAGAIAVAAAAGYLASDIVLLSFDSLRGPLPGGEYLAVALQGIPTPLRAVARVLPPALAGAITLVPAVTLLLSRRRRDPSANAASGPASSDRLPILCAALTPVVVMVAYGYGELGFGLSIPLIWVLAMVFVLQSRARAEITRSQRDKVVAATEVERARLAADLHDDALQEMTVLVRTLDDAGDTKAADLARSIADRLREVCGDLRLPVLDELGAGAALEWLVDRVGETSGSPVHLERAEGSRPPADVELAVFRVAQEALANAVTHGAPPIVVRYSAASDRASLSVTDKGSGIAPDAAAKAARSGHYGLLNMRQRADQIGAKIDVRRPPEGGTSIALSWSSA